MDQSNSFKGVNTGCIDGDRLETVEEQLEKLDSSGLTEEEKEIVLMKLLDEGDENEPRPKTITWEYLDGLVIWKQESEVYCVPACCQSVIHYHTGRIESQSSIAKDLGTTIYGTEFSKAKDYLNKKQQGNKYISRPATTSLSTMKSNFYLSINTMESPAMIDVQFRKKDGWYTDVTGHAMLISGIRNDKEQFRISDPYINWIDNDASMHYIKSAEKIYSAVSERGNGYIF